MADTPYPFSVCEECSTGGDKPYPFSVCKECCTGGGGEGGPLQSKTVTPGETSKKVTPDSDYYGLSAVTVEAIPDKYADVSGVTAISEGVLDGYKFIDKSGNEVTGSMTWHDTPIHKLLDVKTKFYEIPEGYHDGRGMVAIETEERTIDTAPTNSSYIVEPTDGKVLSRVTVNPIPAVTVTPETVLEGTSFVNKDGISIGTMPNQGAVDLGVVPLVSQITIPKGYHNGEGIVRANTEELTVQADKEDIIVCEAGDKFWTKVTVEPATGGGVDAPYSGAVYPWLELNLTDVASQQFKEGAGLNGARTVIMPNVNSIGTAAFMSAPVEVIDIGADVQSIHFAAFNNCARLDKLIFRGLWLAEEKALQLTGTAIKNAAGYIYVPKAYLEQYQSAANWSSFASRFKSIEEEL